MRTLLSFLFIVLAVGAAHSQSRKMILKKHRGEQGEIIIDTIWKVRQLERSLSGDGKWEYDSVWVREKQAQQTAATGNPGNTSNYYDSGLTLRQGTWLLGGQGSFDNAAKTFYFRINAGYFTSPHLAIGAMLDNWEGGDVNFNGFIRPYFGPTEKGSFFAQGQMGVTASQFGYGLGLGYAAFIRSTVALEFSASYLNYGQGYFYPAVGFQIYLPRRK